MSKRDKINWKAVAVTVTVAALLIGTLGLNFASTLPSFSPRSAQATSRELALSCTNDSAVTYHIHPKIHIYINGAEQTIPGDTGITPNCQHVIHTHSEDTDHSTIHIESPEARDFTVGDFFAVWGKDFNQNQVLDRKTDPLHTITMTVNGTPSLVFENQVMHDNDNIIIRYQPITAVSNVQVQTEGGGTVQVTPLPVK